MADDWVLVISRVLSFSVILLSTCMKLPQLLKIYTAGTNRGISIRGYWLEVASLVYKPDRPALVHQFSYSTGASYGFYNGVHYSNYLELIILAMQSVIIIALSIYYSRTWNIENMLWCVLLSIFCGLSVVKAIPGPILDILILLGIPLASSSKSLQINALYKAKSSGDVSVITWSLATYGCGVRLFTTLVEMSSLSVLAAYMTSFVLNFVIVCQILYYSNSRPKTV